MFLFSLIYGIGAAIAAGTLQQLLLQMSWFATTGTPPLHLTAVLLVLATIEELTKTAAVAAGLARVRWHTLLHALLVGIGFCAVEVTLIRLGHAQVSMTALTGTVIVHMTTPLIAAATLLYLADWPAVPRLAVGIAITTLLHAAVNILAMVLLSPAAPAVAAVLGTLVLLAFGATIWLLAPVVRR